MDRHGQEKTAKLQLLMKKKNSLQNSLFFFFFENLYTGVVPCAEVLDHIGITVHSTIDVLYIEINEKEKKYIYCCCQVILHVEHSHGLWGAS